MVIFTSSFNLNLNLDFIPLFLFFLLYSALEILITTTMADFRFIQIDDDEIEEILIPERINLPIRNSNPIQIHEEEELQQDESDEDDDNDDYDDDDYDDDEEDELLIPDIVLPVNLDLINQLEDDDDDDDDSDYDEEEEDDDDDDDEDEEDYEDDESYEEDGEVEEMIPVEMEDRDVSSSVYGDGSVEEDEVDGRKEEVVNRCEIDGLICSICLDAWTSGGQHQISCLPCGHIYGLSCIKKWLLQHRSSGKCPQCNQLCTLKDVRVLYASRLCVADEELHKRVRSLEAKCAYLEQKPAPLTHDELINQICSNPTLVERLATALAGLH